MRKRKELTRRLTKFARQLDHMETEFINHWKHEMELLGQFPKNRLVAFQRAEWHNEKAEDAGRFNRPELQGLKERVSRLEKFSPSEEECECREESPSLENRMHSLEGRFEHLRCEVSQAAPGILREKIAALEEKVHELSLKVLVVTRLGGRLEKRVDGISEGMTRVESYLAKEAKRETEGSPPSDGKSGYREPDSGSGETTKSP